MHLMPIVRKHEVSLIWLDRPYASYSMEMRARAAAISALEKGASEAEANKVLVNNLLAGQKTTGMNFSVRIGGQVFMFD